MDGYKHYIRLNGAGIIIHGFSSAFEQPQDGDILISEYGPRHFQQVWPESLMNERGQYRYKWMDGQRIERSQTELDDEWNARPSAPPSVQEQLDKAVVELTTLIAMQQGG
ncbi:hypothetical protein P4S95_17765 [Aneurinibacillus aneurinilyticus]|uniref:hypothetical protein n=1 Tax=Aneurinibacillus aneurinilyticus TaxID=1391 RepID=UPI002E1FA6FD|nr:hypothetical protein [Aneurinibacillus aneurinilyticus]